MSFFGQIRDESRRAPSSRSSSASTRSSGTPTSRSSARRPVDVETLEALEELLISADIGVAATDRIVAAVQERERAAARACAIW